MKLENDEKSIILTIDSYEFPYHETNDVYDNNWLNVKAVCEDEVLIDEGIDACLLTDELRELRDGLSHVLVNQEYHSSFTEPTLQVSAKPQGEQIWMRIAFALPNRHLFEVESIVSKAQLDAMVSDLSAMVKAFPKREKHILN